jgi:hypothetical protein
MLHARRRARVRRPDGPGSGVRGPEPKELTAKSRYMQRSWHYKQLRRSLHDLAGAGSEQLALFPDRAPKPDELAWAFEHWASIIRGTYETDLSEPEIGSLTAVEEKLKTMSRDGAEFGADLWTDSAVRNSEHWIELRALATAALEAFGWSSEKAGES